MQAVQKSPPVLRKSVRVAGFKSAPASRSARLGLRSSEAQLAVIRHAAQVAHKSLTDFILDSACLAAQQTLIDQRLFMLSDTDYRAFAALLDRPVRSNAGLKALFSRQAPWGQGKASNPKKKAVSGTNSKIARKNATGRTISV